jgi:hypothetical protein
MPRTTKTARPASTLSAFEEKFGVMGSGDHPAWDALLAPLTPSQRLTVALALVEDAENAALERSRKSMAVGNATRSIRLDALADRLQRIQLDIAQCETEWTRI